jgi:hypothetical protein
MRLNNLDTLLAFEMKQFKGYLCKLEYLNNYLLLVQHGKFENIHFQKGFNGIIGLISRDIPIAAFRY